MKLLTLSLLALVLCGCARVGKIDTTDSRPCLRGHDSNALSLVVAVFICDEYAPAQ